LNGSDRTGYRAVLSYPISPRRARLPFRTLIVLLVVVSTLPLVLLTGVLLTRLVAEQRAADERRLFSSRSCRMPSPT
jgi:hypothetical protein